MRPADGLEEAQGYAHPTYGVPRPPRPAAVPPPPAPLPQQLEYDSHAAIDLDDEPELPSAPPPHLGRAPGGAAAAAAAARRAAARRTTDCVVRSCGSRYAARRADLPVVRDAAPLARRAGRGARPPLRRPRARRAHSRRRPQPAARRRRVLAGARRHTASISASISISAPSSAETPTRSASSRPPRWRADAPPLAPHLARADRNLAPHLATVWAAAHAVPPHLPHTSSRPTPSPTTREPPATCRRLQASTRSSAAPRNAFARYS